jgi:putative endonuclease
MNFFVYILQADDGFYYTGQTSDIEARLKQHQQGRVTATSYRSGWRVMHVEEFSSRVEAMRRERQIKARKSRKYIERLIATAAPRNDDVPATVRENPA